MSTKSDIPDIIAEKLINRLQITIIFVAITVITSLLFSAFMPLDMYQKIAVVASAVIIVIALLAVLWIQWTRSIIKQERVLKS